MGNVSHGNELSVPIFLCTSPGKLEDLGAAFSVERYADAIIGSSHDS
jgi:hypothetical protein